MDGFEIARGIARDLLEQAGEGADPARGHRPARTRHRAAARLRRRLSHDRDVQEIRRDNAARLSETEPGGEKQGRHRMTRRRWACAGATCDAPRAGRRVRKSPVKHNEKSRDPMDHGFFCCLFEIATGRRGK